MKYYLLLRTTHSLIYSLPPSLIYSFIQYLSLSQAMLTSGAEDSLFSKLNVCPGRMSVVATSTATCCCGSRHCCRRCAQLLPLLVLVLLVVVLVLVVCVGGLCSASGGGSSAALSAARASSTEHTYAGE